MAEVQRADWHEVEVDMIEVSAHLLELSHLESLACHETALQQLAEE